MKRKVATAAIVLSMLAVVPLRVSPAHATQSTSHASSETTIAGPAGEIDPDEGGAVVMCEPAGNYEYTCTGVDGNSYTYKYDDLPRCVGYVDVYINGEQIAHYGQTGQTASLSCTLGAATQIVQIFTGSVYTGWGMAAWLFSSYLVALGCSGS